jgi:methylase of polypeptide subunit release factors
VPGGDVLDLCSGPGIQSLIASRAARRVVGVEINPDASRVARLNQRMNGVGSQLEFVNFSLENFAKQNTAKFDRILFNPPLVPVPEDLAYPFVGHGGGDGLSVTNTVIGAYLDSLTPTGRFEFIGMTVGAREKLSPSDPLMVLAKKYRLEGTVHVLSRHRIREESPMLNSCAGTLARSNGLDLPAARERLLQYFREAEYDHFYLFHCSWGRPLAGKKPKCDVVDMSFYYFGDWFA